MGEPVPIDPPSGDCPGCIGDMPAIIHGKVTLPLVPKVFEGILPFLWDNGNFVVLNAIFCVGEDNHVSLATTGGWLGGLIYSCQSPGYDCWLSSSCDVPNPWDGLVAILEIT